LDLIDVAVVNTKLRIDCAKRRCKFARLAKNPKSRQISLLMRNQNRGSIRKLIAFIESGRQVSHLAKSHSLLRPCAFATNCCRSPPCTGHLPPVYYSVFPPIQQGLI